MFGFIRINRSKTGLRFWNDTKTVFGDGIMDEPALITNSEMLEQLLKNSDALMVASFGMMQSCDPDWLFRLRQDRLIKRAKETDALLGRLNEIKGQE